MRFFLFLPFLTFFIVSCSNIQQKDSLAKPVIDESRLVAVSVDLEGMIDDRAKTKKVYLLDTYQESLKNIIKELQEEHFPIYEVSCYANRPKRGSNAISLHAYSAAVDINYFLNPYFDVLTKNIIPARSESSWRKLNFVEHTNENEDYFINREVKRPGMITEKEAEIFAKYGFTIWGGKWRRPMDFMHFQTTKAIAKIVAGLNSEEAKIFWNAYLKDPKTIANDSFFSEDINPQNIDLKIILGKIEEILECKKKS